MVRTGQYRSSFGEDLLEQGEDFGHVQLHVLEVQQVLVVLLLWNERRGRQIWGAVSRSGGRRTFSNRSSIFRSISRMAFSRPL